MLMVRRFSQDDDFLNLLPSKWWVNFFKKFDEIDNIPISKWKPVHQLSYLTQRYEEVYGKRFSFALTGTPSKCGEIYMIKKMMAVLGTSNQKTIKEYIDWVYDRKIIPQKRKIRSVGFFINSSFCNEFHLDRIEKNKITRNTALPKEYKSVVDTFGLGLDTFGDLAFAKQAIDEEPDDKSREPYRKLFHELYRVGFQYNILDNIV